ncbi:hypothetical protein F7725_027915 [Dissostichus mawsoni]|uniref:Cns1/TTC4 wheel domain-containing protein n=1 Tax=Dissostichus mawsoni TaxID=36200 RepID=A0A7J5XFJ8_DISMA|nr:hypothetical protein F7725_027915 [Dissostichus mawsoni]
MHSLEATGARVFLDEQHILHWPVLFLYPEHQQTDFISAFCKNDCFVNHLAVMFGEETPTLGRRQKIPSTESAGLFFVSPSFLVVVKGSPFWEQFSTGKKIRGL